MPVITTAVVCFLGTAVLEAVKTKIKEKITAGVGGVIDPDKKDPLLTELENLNKTTQEILAGVREIAAFQQFQFKNEKIEAFVSLKEHICQTTTNLLTTSTVTEEHKGLIQQYINGIEIGGEKNYFTELKLSLIGGKIQEEDKYDLIKVKSNFLISEKNKPQGVLLFNYCVEMLNFLDSALEAVAHLKAFYIKGCAILEKEPESARLTDMDNLADAVVERVFENRNKTFDLFHYLYNEKKTVFSNLVAVEADQGLKGNGGDGFYIPETLSWSNKTMMTMKANESWGSFYVNEEPPVVLQPNDNTNPAMGWKLSYNPEKQGIYITHQESSKRLGWYTYGIKAAVGLLKMETSLGENGITYFLGLANFSDTVHLEPNKTGETTAALWDIVLTGDDTHYMFKNMSNNCVIRIEKDKEYKKCNVIDHHDRQFGVNQEPNIDEIKYKLRIDVIEYQ